MKNDAGEMSMSEDTKQKAWLEHYQSLLNVEFDWDPDHLSYQPPVEGPPIPITIDMFVCVEVLRPSQPNGVMSSAVSLPNHTFTGQA